MEWTVEYTNEFEAWWVVLNEPEQEDIDAIVQLLEKKGPNLPFPHSSGINLSEHTHMRELRIQHAGRPYRIFYAFDPRRTAILLIGGDKTGNDAFYKQYVPIADRLYDEHLRELKNESGNDK